MEHVYRGLNFLDAVVREGSFESAARNLGVTQSAVSQRIKQLECSLGSPLVKRKRPVIPTATGELWLEHLSEVRQLQNKLKDHLASLTSAHGQTVKLSVEGNALYTWFPEVVRRVTKHLNTQLEVTAHDNASDSKLLEDESLAAAVTNSKTADADSLATEIASMKYVAVCSSQFFEQHFGFGVDIDSLAAAPSISASRDNRLTRNWIKKACDTSAVLNSNYLPMTQLKMDCVQNGSAWSVLPLLSVNSQLASGELVNLRDDIVLETPVYWIEKQQNRSKYKDLRDLVSSIARTTLSDDAPALVN